MIIVPSKRGLVPQKTPVSEWLAISGPKVSVTTVTSLDKAIWCILCARYVLALHTAERGLDTLILEVPQGFDLGLLKETWDA